MGNYQYRMATEGDIGFISRVYNENIAALHGTDRDADTWNALLAEKDSIYYIVYAVEPVAWFRIDREADKLWLGMLQVKPAWHRQGIGRYILSVMETLAREQKIPVIGVHTTQDNEAAWRLYRSAGYQVTEIGPCTTADGVERVGYTLEKSAY